MSTKDAGKGFESLAQSRIQIGSGCELLIRMRGKYAVIEHHAEPGRVRHLKASIGKFGPISADDIEVERTFSQLVF